MSPNRTTVYLEAARSAVTLLAQPEVAANWERPSALAEFGVRGLAGHLAAQLFRVPEVLALPVSAGEPIPLLEHYARSSWVTATVHDEVSVLVRQKGDSLAENGPAALVGQAADVLDELTAELPAEPADRVVHLPWGPWSLRLDDFLTTRLMEIAVHSDDLAVSVGLPTPELPPEVREPVLELLTRLAVQRHGPTAVLRALSRAERAPGNISAF